MININFRNKIIAKSNYDIPSDMEKLIYNKELDKQKSSVKSLTQILSDDTLVKSICDTKNKINIQDMITKPTSNLVYMSEFTNDKMAMLATLSLSESLYNEIKIKNNHIDNKFVICFDDMNNKLLELNKLFSIGNKYNLCIINITSCHNKKNIISGGNLISFSVSELDADSLSLSFRTSPQRLLNLDRYEFLCKEYDSTKTFKSKLDI